MKSINVKDSLEGEEEAYTGAVTGDDTAYSVIVPPFPVL